MSCKPFLFFHLILFRSEYFKARSEKTDYFHSYLFVGVVNCLDLYEIYSMGYVSLGWILRYITDNIFCAGIRRNFLCRYQKMEIL